MTESAWSDYVEWSGLDEARLAEILRDRDDAGGAASSRPGDGCRVHSG
ncbi:hypothetical protein [Dietzia sp. PP-33]|nr:hypothetical protein [Dietzia sp. PP-33]MDX2358327.1 hypothetical protein [Dietzia sp. PP-33]